jgi:hypothetical protein
MAPKKTKKELTEEERSKMLERLAEMRNTVAKNRELKKQSATASATTATDNKSKNPEVFRGELDIKKKPILAEETHAKLDKIALHLEELTTLKKDKIRMKREEKEKDLKEKEEKVKNVVVAEAPKQVKEVNIVPPTPTAYAAPTFKLPASMGSRLWSGGRF